MNLNERIKEYIDNHNLSISNAIKEVVSEDAENGILRNAATLERSYYRYKKLNALVLKSETLNKNGEIISQKFGKEQIEDDIDESNYEPQSFTTNPFGQGKWIRYDKQIAFSPKDFIAEYDARKNNFKRRIKPLTSTHKVGVICLADFHAGACVTNLLKSPDFNLDILKEKLFEVASEVNKLNFKEVHLALLGDFIESFTGLNHLNSWKNLDKKAYGMQGVIICHEILSECLFTQINNLHWVGYVSGNHDRVTSNKQEDDSGEVAQMLHYLFKKDFQIPSDFSYTVISKVIDNISYIFSHGDLFLNKKDATKIILDYGVQGLYNVLASGHKHTLETKKSFKKSLVIFCDNEFIKIDEQDYLSITCRPIFTGNPYSEGLGYTSNSGFTVFTNNGKDKVNQSNYII